MFSQQKKQGVRSTGQDEGSAEERRARGKREKCLGPSIFITKTYEILENKFFAAVVSWNAEGTHFIIHDVDRFEQEVLPIYFRHRKFSSFVRQLNMYDFHKIRNESNKNIFQHKQFRRAHAHSLQAIKRKGCGAHKRPRPSHKHSSPSEIFESDAEFNFDHFDDPNAKPADQRLTLSTIHHSSVVAILQNPLSTLQNPLQPHHSSVGSILQSPIRHHHSSVTAILQTPAWLPSPHCEEKERAMNEFVSNLPENIASEEQIKTIIAQLKKQNLSWLTTKHDVHKIIKKIKRCKMTQLLQDDGLQDLSIEEEIMAENIDKNIDRTIEPSQQELQIFHSEIWQNGSTGLAAVHGGEEWFCY